MANNKMNTFPVSILVLILVISTAVNVNFASAFNLSLKARRGLSFVPLTRVGMVTTGLKGKPASSKEEDLEKTISLILLHQDKINGPTASSSASSSSSLRNYNKETDDVTITVVVEAPEDEVPVAASTSTSSSKTEKTKEGLKRVGKALKKKIFKKKD